MKKNKKIILIGGGGHCKSSIDIIESIKKYEIFGIIDKKNNLNNKILQYKVIGCDKDLEKIRKKISYAIITIGQIKSPKTRISIYNKLKKIGFYLPNIFSNQSIISKYSKIGEGTIVMDYAKIGPSSFVGNNCIINSNALVEHDCYVNDHTHISTGAILNGNVTIGKGSFVGSGTVIKNNIFIGKNVLIGAGLFIKTDIKDNEVIINE